MTGGPTQGPNKAAALAWKSGVEASNFDLLTRARECFVNLQLSPEPPHASSEYREGQVWRDENMEHVRDCDEARRMAPQETCVRRQVGKSMTSGVDFEFLPGSRES